MVHFPLLAMLHHGTHHHSILLAFTLGRHVRRQKGIACTITWSRSRSRFAHGMSPCRVRLSQRYPIFEETLHWYRHNMFNILNHEPEHHSHKWNTNLRPYDLDRSDGYYYTSRRHLRSTWLRFFHGVVYQEKVDLVRS